MTVADLFLITAALAILCLIILWKGVSSAPKIPSIDNGQTLPQRLKHLLKNKALLRLDASILIAHALLTALFVALPLQLKQQLGLNAEQQWKLYLPVFLIAAIIIGGLLHRMRHSDQQQIYFRTCVALICLSMLGFVSQPHHLWSLGAVLLLFFIGFTLLEALLPSLVTMLAPSNTRGTALGIYSSCQFFGIFCGGLLGGLLMEHFSTLGFYLGLLILSIFWLMLSWPKFTLQ